MTRLKVQKERLSRSFEINQSQEGLVAKAIVSPKVMELKMYMLKL